MPNITFIANPTSNDHEPVEAPDPPLLLLVSSGSFDIDSQDERTKAIFKNVVSGENSSER